MNNCHCNTLSCSHSAYPGTCRSSCCTTSDALPACNPCAPWGWTACSCSRCSNSSTCGASACTDSWNSCAASACSPSCGCGASTGCGSSCGCNTSTGCGSSCGCNASTGCGSSCGCGSWHSCSSGASGYLIPRYVSIGRTFQRQMTQTLCVDGIPDCADSPLTLTGVTVCGQSTWEQLSECRQQLLRVVVPVAVQIRDCSGRCRTGHASVTLTIPLCGCSQQDFWRGQLYVAPCIRLAAPVTENEDGCFDAPLEVSADVYLVRLVATSSTSC